VRWWWLLLLLLLLIETTITSNMQIVHTIHTRFRQQRMNPTLRRDHLRM